jgi:hypothetical protein
MANDIIERKRAYTRTYWAKAQGINGTSYGEAGSLYAYDESGALGSLSGGITFGAFGSSSETLLERGSMSARRGERVNYQKTVITESLQTLTSGTSGNTCTGDLEVECDVFEFNWNLNANIVFMCNKYRISGISGNSFVLFESGTSSSTATHFRKYSIGTGAGTSGGTGAGTSGGTSGQLRTQLSEEGKQIDIEFGLLDFETAEVMCMDGVPWKGWK